VEVHVREMATERESLIAGREVALPQPVLSPEGSKVAYMDRREGKLVTHVAESGSPSGRVVCEECLVCAFFPGAAEALVRVGDRLTRRRLDGGGEVPLIEAPAMSEVALSPTASGWLSRRTGRTVRRHCTRLPSRALLARRSPGDSLPRTAGTSGRPPGRPTAGFSTTCRSGTGLRVSGLSPSHPMAGSPARP